MKYGQEEKDADQNSFNIFKSLEKKSRNTADLIGIFFDYDFIKKTTNPKTFKLDKNEELKEFKKFNDIKSDANAKDLIKNLSLEKDEKERLNIYLNTELDKKEEEELKAKAEENPKARLIPKMSSGLSRRAGRNALTAPEEKSNQTKPSEAWLNDVKSKDYRTLRDDPISLSHHPDYLSINFLNADKEDQKETLKKLEKFKENPYYDSAREHILNSLYPPIEDEDEDEDEGEEQYEDLPIEGEGEGEEQYEAPPVTQVEPPVAQDKPVSKPVAQVEPPVAQDKPVSKPVAQNNPILTPWRSKKPHYGLELTVKPPTAEDEDDEFEGF
jgi:hypothetical protein